MNGTCGKEHMDSWTRGILQGAPRRIDISSGAARETGDDRALDFASHEIHRLPIAARRDWETGFDDVDPELRERFRDPQLFWLSHAAAGRLLAVAQRGVEDEDAVGVGHRCLDDGAAQTKFAASFTSPEPRYCATCG
jgi:hypothetical protein